MPDLLSFAHPDGGTVRATDVGWFHDGRPIYLALALAGCARDDGDFLATERFRNEQVVPAHRRMIEAAVADDDGPLLARLLARLVAELQDAASPVCDLELAKAKGIAVHSVKVYKSRRELPLPMRESPRGDTQSFPQWSPRQVDEWLAGDLPARNAAA